MLQLVFGRAGSGKTRYALERLQKALGEYERVFWIVPEQASFESERALLHQMGPKDAQKVEVLSFTRLADRVMREYGGLAGKRIDECGKCLFMSLALEKTADSLRLYQKQAENAEFVSLMAGEATRLKMNGVTPAALQAAAQALPDGTLRRKSEEVALILTAYDALIGQSYADPLDDLTRLAEKLEEHPFFAGALVVADGFRGFTAQEFAVLRHMVRQAAELTVTLCADKLADPEQGMGLFSSVRKTARRLLELARRQGVEAAAPVSLPPGGRFHTPALSTLEAVVFRNQSACDLINPEEVALLAAPHKYAEAQWIARSIRRMMREEGWRCRDIAVIVRRVEDYAGILDAAFEEYGIPYFMDTPERVDAKPLAALILAALDAVAGGFESDAIFRCLKTGLYGLSCDEISALENYAFVWNIRGGMWKNEWKMHPAGFSDSLSEEEQETLAYLNLLRRRVVEPLLRLEEAKEEDGAGLSHAAYDFLERTGAQTALAAQAKALEEKGYAFLAEQQLRLWDLLMEILDQAAVVLERTRVGLKRFAQLLRLAINRAELGKIPQRLDEVTVGAADRIRPAAPRAVFIAGANQGVFPLSTPAPGVFSRADCAALAACGLELGEDDEAFGVEERMLAYSALASPSERLFVSFSRADAKGEETPPSEIVSELKRLFRLREREELAGVASIECKSQAFAMLAEDTHSKTALSATLLDYFTHDDEMAPVVAALNRAAGNAVKFTDPQRAQRLFGRRMRLSPSRVEKYHQCPFSYFCRYGVHALPRRAARIDALEYGTLLHYVLERLLSSHTAAQLEAMPRAALGGTVRAVLEEYIEKKLGGWEDKSDRFRYLYRRFESTAVSLVAHIACELAQSSFSPVDFELAIGRPEEEGAPFVPALTIPLPDGGSMEVFGKVDRVDLMRVGEKSYIRVVDYKTGAKKFALRDVLYGVNLQMLIYLATIWKNGEARYGPVVPAGVLYMPAKSPKVEGERGQAAEEIAKKREAGLRMNGLVLEDERVVRGMEREARGVFIPVRLKADGTPAAASQLASLAQIGMIGRHIEGLLREMGAHLQQGEIPVSPLEKACTYCDYAGVCGHERDDPEREMEAVRDQEALARIEARLPKENE